MNWTGNCSLFRRRDSLSIPSQDMSVSLFPFLLDLGQWSTALNLTAYLSCVCSLSVSLTLASWSLSRSKRGKIRDRKNLMQLWDSFHRKTHAKTSLVTPRRSPVFMLPSIDIHTGFFPSLAIGSLRSLVTEGKCSPRSWVVHISPVYDTRKRDSRWICWDTSQAKKLFLCLLAIYFFISPLSHSPFCSWQASARLGARSGSHWDVFEKNDMLKTCTACAHIYF